MKSALFLLLILSPLFSFGQDWAPVGAKWVYDHDSGLSQYLTTIESVKDTTVMGKVCRQLVTCEIDELMRQDGSYYWDTSVVSKDYIYQSNDTVYHFNKFENLFYPLYLLNVAANDTVLIRRSKAQCDENEYFCSRFEYVVDDISCMSLQGQALKVIYNSATDSAEWVFNRSFVGESYPIVERIGSLKYLFGVSRDFAMEGGIKCLRCYTDASISYKADYWDKDCDYLPPLNGPSTIGETKADQLLVSPNPFNSAIRLGDGAAVAYELYNSLGKLLLNGNGTEINTSSLHKGVYLLRITQDGGAAKTVRVVKE